jgi:branched-chain amino acid transport system substrate-binding protein
MIVRNWISSLFCALLASALAAAAQDLAPLKIGVLVPLTGDAASSYGEAAKNGVLLAEQLASKRRIQLVFEDSKCLPKEAVSGAKKLITVDNVIGIIGDVCWTDVLAQVTEPAKVVVLSTGSAQSAVREAGDYVFRLKLDVSVDSKALAAALIERVGIRSASVICADDNWGQGVASNFIAEFERLGGSVKGKHCVLPSDTDFRPILTKVRAEKPEILVIAAYPVQTGLAAKQARQLGYTGKLAAYRGGMGEPTLSLGGEALEGLLFIDEFDVDSDRAAAASFVSAFRNKLGRDPGLFDAMGYDAYNLFNELAASCGHDSECFKRELYRIKGYSGACGSLSFDEKGDVEKSLEFKQISKGKFVGFGG